MSEQEPIEQEGDGLGELTEAFRDALSEIERGAIDPSAVRGGASFSVADTSTTLYLRVALAPGAAEVPKPAVQVREGGLWVDGILICEVADIPNDVKAKLSRACFDGVAEVYGLVPAVRMCTGWTIVTRWERDGLEPLVITAGSPSAEDLSEANEGVPE